MNEPRAVRLGLSVAAGATAAAPIYALLRAYQALLGTEPDPALIFYSEHAGFFWRALTAGYLAGSVGFVVWLVSGRDAAPVARVLARAVPIAIGVSLAQGLLVP